MDQVIEPEARTRPRVPLLSGVSQRALTTLERATNTARKINAHSIVHEGKPHPVMGPIASLYFSLAARQWDAFAQDPDHAGGFAVALGDAGRPTSIVDLGTGAGVSAAMLADRFPDASVLAIDTSRRMLAAAAERYQAPNLTFQRATVTSLPVQDGSVDLVTMLNAVPSIPEVTRITHVGSRILASSTYVQAQPEGSPWLQAWSEHGFERVATAPYADGYWEILERVR